MAADKKPSKILTVIFLREISFDSVESSPALPLLPDGAARLVLRLAQREVDGVLPAAEVVLQVEVAAGSGRHQDWGKNMQQ